MCIDFVVLFDFPDGGVCLRFSFDLQQFGSAGMEQLQAYWRGSWKSKRSFYFTQCVSNQSMSMSDQRSMPSALC